MCGLDDLVDTKVAINVNSSTLSNILWLSHYHVILYATTYIHTKLTVGELYIVRCNLRSVPLEYPVDCIIIIIVNCNMK
jgi:hypothetical protein